jgi:CheY-like chemotaxis protein
MPIVDGLTSTKMIRSFEKSHPTHVLSKRAARNGRVPIIAVSASLIEKERQVYIDAGFDGWILKPIAFDRLKQIMLGIVDAGARKDNLYKSGGWERGGWFQQAQKDIFAADTTPSDRMPMTDPSEGAQKAASSEDPFVREEDDSLQTQEQARMAENQEKEREVMGIEDTGEVDTPKVSAVAEIPGDEPSPDPETGNGEEETASEPPPPADS